MKTYDDIYLDNDQAWDIYTQSPDMDKLKPGKQENIRLLLRKIIVDIAFINDIENYYPDYPGETTVNVEDNREMLTEEITVSLNKVKSILETYSSPLIFNPYDLTFDDLVNDGDHYNELYSLAYTLKKRLFDYDFVKQWEPLIKEITTTIFTGLANYFLYAIEH